MIHKLIVRVEARADIVEAHRWYEDRSEGLGLEFVRATDTCFDLISRNPNIYPKFYKEVHRALLSGFPFAVFFRVRHDTISIIACTHVRRQSRTLEEPGIVGAICLNSTARLQFPLQPLLPLAKHSSLYHRHQS